MKKLEAVFHYNVFRRFLDKGNIIMGPFMQRVKFGEVEWIQGENRGHFPFCNTLLIQDGIKVVIDPGAGLELMTQVSDHVNVDLVINTHFHFDHIAYNYLFRQSKIYLNEIEGECFQDRRKILKRLGMTDFYGDEWAQGWLDRISRPDSVQSPYSPQNRHEWWLSTERLDGTYGWGEGWISAPQKWKSSERRAIPPGLVVSIFPMRVSCIRAISI
jgi:hypothetical protein